MAWKEPPKEECPYNEYVECRRDKSDCSRCGWNPKVDAQRRKEQKERMEGNAEGND